MSHNVYDDGSFFEQYNKIRNKAESYNNTIEQPSMKELLPNLQNKAVLDLGCGLGCNCMDFLEKGAAKVIGVDISEKMIDAAKKQSEDKNVEYIRLDMQNIDEIEEKFDFVYSSLAIHYIFDFEGLLKKIYDILNENGIFLFSQEHPLATAPLEGPSWIKDEQGKKLSSTISNYLENGERNIKWLGENTTKHHRTFSYIINSLVENSFSIEKIVEPAPSAKALEIAPFMYDEFHRPTAIIIKAQRV